MSYISPSESGPELCFISAVRQGLESRVSFYYQPFFIDRLSQIFLSEGPEALAAAIRCDVPVGKRVFLFSHIIGRITTSVCMDELPRDADLSEKIAKSVKLDLPTFLEEDPLSPIMSVFESSRSRLSQAYKDGGHDALEEAIIAAKIPLYYRGMVSGRIIRALADPQSNQPIQTESASGSSLQRNE